MTEAEEVRVRVLGACVQFTDVIRRKGMYPGLREKPPLVLGYDVVGEIDRVGPEGDPAFRIGDRVASLTVTGSYARYRTVAATELVRVPRDVDPAEAATLVLSWKTRGLGRALKGCSKIDAAGPLAASGGAWQRD